VDPDALAGAVAEEVNLLLAAGPTAQAALKQLWRSVRDDALKQSAATVETIAKLRSGPSGQTGLKAFFAKEAPEWTASVDASAFQPRSAT
jgi:methylglutaconyl-CoA hydratase